MSIYKLKTSAEYKFGAKNLIPYGGEVEFDKEGNFEVELKDDSELELLLNDVPDFYNPNKIENIKHIVEEEDLNNNPELKEAGIEKGDEIEIPILPQTEENELGKSEDEKNDIGKPDEDEEDSEVGVADTLDKLSVGELRSLAKESGFPEEEWKQLGKVELRNYLKDKL
jgi:hypothetical protein